MIGPEFYLSLFFQSAKLAPPLHSGLLGLPFVFLEGMGGIISGLIIHHTGRYNTLLWVGACTMTLGFGLLIDLKVFTSLDKIIIYQCIAALGSGLLIQPPLVAIQTNVSQGDTVTTTSTLNFVRGLAQAVSIAIGGVIFQSSMDAKQSCFHNSGISPQLSKTFSGSNAQAHVGKLRTLKNGAQRHIVQVAYADSLEYAWIMYSGIAALTLVAFYFVGTHGLSTEQVETRTGLLEQDDRSR